jgi:hypothetical protein
MLIANLTRREVARLHSSASANCSSGRPPSAIEIDVDSSATIASDSNAKPDARAGPAIASPTPSGLNGRTR